MNLQTLIVNGFKSFPEAKIEFPQGITAVVGPNGTGKSNIVDAILWVLGEQSAKSLRSERMEDVIFNGTELRKPIGMVEVSLIFNGVTNQELEVLSSVGEDIGHSTEVMITRRLFREGESEYLLNKIPCRLKDIRGLLWSARAGIKGHTVIEQGNIDQLLNASPLERRDFIEETAGIMRYKKQKVEALRKLNSTQQNLFRVRDILSEVRRQLRSLERQAKQAKDFQALQLEAKALEILLLEWDYRTLVGTRGDIEKELKESEVQELTHLAEETRLMAEQEEARLSLTSTGESVSQAQSQLREIEQGMAQALTRIEVERSRMDQYEQHHTQAITSRTRLLAEAEQAKGKTEAIVERLSQIRSEIEKLTTSLANDEQQNKELTSRRTISTEDLNRVRHTMLDMAVEKTHAENQVKSLEEKYQTLTRRLERLAGEQAELEANHNRLSTEAAACHHQRLASEAELQHLRVMRQEAEQSLHSFKNQLREMEVQLLGHQTELAGTQSGIRALRTVMHEEFGYGPTGEIEQTSVRGACQEIREAFAERMEVPEQVEKAIEAALGDRIKAWMVESPEEAARAIITLKSHSLGRGVFVPLQGAGVQGETDHPWWPTLKSEPGVCGHALDFVQVPQELKPATDRMMRWVVIVKTVEDALEIMERHNWFQGQGPVLVTLTGETVHPSGMVAGGSGGEAGGILHRRREILRLEEKTKELVRDIEVDQSRRDILFGDMEATQNHVESLDHSIRETEVQLLSLQKEEQARDQTLSELKQRILTIQMERDFEENEGTRMEEESRHLKQRTVELESIQNEREKNLKEITDSLSRIDEEITKFNTGIMEAQMSLSTLRAQWTHGDADRVRLRQEEEDRKTRIQSLDQQLEQLFLQTRQSQEERIHHEGLFEELETKKESKTNTLSELDDQYTQVLEKTKMIDHRLAETRETLSARLKARGMIEVRLAEVRTKITAVEATLTETYGLTVESVREGEGELEKTRAEFHEAEDQNQEPLQISPDLWREELQRIRNKIERIGPINLTAINEHQELEQRYQFLAEQEEDLSQSIQSLQEIIRKLNQTTGRLFSETFRDLQEKFQETFTALFGGGHAELVLVEPEKEEDSETFTQDPGVDIVAQPPGKRLKNLAMLSGGEKTLTVMGLLFASFLIKPSPFCVLDEVDAPLDEANITRFSQFMVQMAERSQFIIITHNKRTMEVADSLFGVTMEEPGISRLVSVRLNELQEVS